MPAHLRRATTRIAVRIPTEPFSPTGCFASGIVPVALVAGVDGLAFCRVWCINAERVVVRICYGRGCWQAVGLPGSVAQAGATVMSQAVRSAGKNRIKNTSIKHLQICIVRQILSRFSSIYPNIPPGTISWHGVFLDSKCIAQLLAHDSLNMKKPHNPPAIGIGI